jgi:hypothetical protein
MVNQANTVSDDGVSYYVVSGDRKVAGPFGSKEYARTVSKRLSDRWSTTAIEGEIR